MKVMKGKAVALDRFVKIRKGVSHGWSAAFLAIDCKTKSLFWVHKYNSYCNISKNEIFEYETNAYPHRSNFSARRATGVFVLPRKKIHSSDIRKAQFINSEIRKYSSPIYYKSDKILNKLREKHFKAIHSMNLCKNIKDLTRLEDITIKCDKWISKIIKIRDYKIRTARETLYAIYELSPRSYDNFYI